MDNADAQPTIQVEVAYSAAPRQVEVTKLSLPAGAVLADAVQASGLIERHGLTLDGQLVVGVWMKLRPLDTPLREADRVEIYRGLRVDPKEARRQRYQQHKDRLAKTASR
jgi:uncharacterized protein